MHMGSINNRMEALMGRQLALWIEGSPEWVDREEDEQQKVGYRITGGGDCVEHRWFGSCHRDRHPDKC